MNPAATQREYHLLRCLGRGGFGEVYLARIRSAEGQFELDAAVKLLHGRLSPDSDAVARLRDEGRLLALVDHPAILGVRDLLVLDGRVALVTEFVDGQDLSALLREPKARLPLRVLLETVGVVADALHAAQTTLGRDGRPLQIVHRDIKPSNIRISRHGSVKLLDFGIARSDATAREADTATDTILGSLPYMAPERFDSNNTEPASDVFALGCVLYEGLAGRLLFDQPMPVMIGLAHSAERHAAQVAKLVDALEGAPADVVELLRAMLGYELAGRPRAREVADRCDTLAQATAGPTLRAWARDRVWPEAKQVDAELDGRVLTEGAARREPVTVPLDPGTIEARTLPLAPEGRSWATVLGVLGVGSGALVAATGLVVVVAVGLGLWVTRGLGGVPAPVAPGAAVVVAAPAPAPVDEAPAVAPAPAVATLEAPDPGVPDPGAPDPGAGAPERPPRVTPPRVGAPAPDVASPSEPPRTFGTVSAGAQWKLTLRDSAGARPLGDVPPGTYDILSDFGDGNGTVVAGKLTVGVGDMLRVQCNAVGQTCGVAK